MLSEIKAQALDLGIGESANGLVCPKCGGGIHKDKAFSITRTEAGLVFTCFRAKCQYRGFIPSIPSALPPRSRRTRTKKFDHTTTEIPDDIIELICSTYSLTPQDLDDMFYAPDVEQVGLELCDPRGYIRGYMTRRLPGDLRKPKTMIYPTREDYVSLYYAGEFPIHASSIVLVEDIWGAKRVNNILPAGALLGTHLSEDAVKELLAIGINQVYLALDADAWVKAITMQSKYGIYFKRGITILTWDSQLDPKDMSGEEFDEVFGSL